MYAKLLGSLCLVSVSSGIFATTEEAMMLLLLEERYKSGGFVSSAACLGSTPDKVYKFAKTAMVSCYKTHGMDDDVGLSNCIEEFYIKEHKISRKTFDSCFDETDAEESSFSSNREMGDIGDKLDALYFQIGDGEPSADQQRYIDSLNDRMRVLLAKQRSEGVEGGEQVVDMMRTASAGTENLITLPIFPGSQIQMHLVEGGSFGGNTGLPSATFSSSKSPESIIAYYKKTLPTFKQKALDGGDYIFMESMPKGFSILKHMKEYMGTPHVLVSKARGMPGVQSKIEISYKKK